MKNTDKRFIIYCWDQSEMSSFTEDNGIEFEEALESGRRDISDYGTYVDSTDDEDEANDIASRKFDSMRYDSIVSIYDNQEHYWFN